MKLPIVTISLKIQQCFECPFHKKTMDEDKTDLKCMKSNRFVEKEIAWHRTNKIAVPEWCEIKEK